MILYDEMWKEASNDDELVEHLETIFHASHCGWKQVAQPQHKILGVLAEAPTGPTSASIFLSHVANQTLSVVENATSGGGTMTHFPGASIDELRFSIPTQTGDAHAFLWDLTINAPSSAGGTRPLPLRVKVRRGGPGF